jgi:SAM-dependent methyltransferase
MDMKRIFHKIGDNTNQESLASKMRRSRFTFFLDLLESVPKPISILDVGGTQIFWEMMGFTSSGQIRITLLNLELPQVDGSNFLGLVGDATNLSAIRDQQFDVVFSNSVIEHVGDFEQQRCMASEIRRVGKRYFVQTPNYYFPIEPHYLFPAFQWLPESVRVGLIRHFDLGHIKRITDPTEAQEQVRSIRLLKRNELLKLFTDCNLYEEKFLGLVKSFVVYSHDW